MTIAALSSQDYGNLLLLTTAFVYAIVLFVTRRGSQAQALLEVMSMIQSEEMRSDRRALYEGAVDDIGEWSNDLRAAAERVASVYGTVGMLFKARMIPRHIFLRQTGRTLVRMCDLVEPFLTWRAQQYGESETWPAFTFMAGRAQGFWRWYYGFDTAEHEAWRTERTRHQQIAAVAEIRDELAETE